MKTFVDNVCRQVIEKQIMSKLGVAFHPAPICGKPLRATREYLETAKRLEACFQYFATEGLADKVRF